MLPNFSKTFIGVLVLCLCSLLPEKVEAQYWTSCNGSAMSYGSTGSVTGFSGGGMVLPRLFPRVRNRMRQRANARWQNSMMQTVNQVASYQTMSPYESVVYQTASTPVRCGVTGQVYNNVPLNAGCPGCGNPNVATVDPTTFQSMTLNSTVRSASCTCENCTCGTNTVSKVQYATPVYTRQWVNPNVTLPMDCSSGVCVPMGAAIRKKSEVVSMMREVDWL